MIVGGRGLSAQREDQGDGPAYPAQQLVVGVLEGRAIEWALFAWADGTADFVEVGRGAF